MSCSIKVNIERPEESQTDSTVYWSLVILFEMENNAQFSFGITEPYCSTEEEWFEFVESLKSKEVCHMSFYQGNGDGSMHTNGESLSFIAEPSGGGGDVHSMFVIPIPNDFTEKLERALVHAKNNNCRFYKRQIRPCKVKRLA